MDRRITLLGQYVAGDFALSNDGVGGSLVTAPLHVDGGSLLATNQH